MGRSATRWKEKSKFRKLDLAVLVVGNAFIRFGHLERIFCGGYLTSVDLVAWICSLFEGLEIRLIHGSSSYPYLHRACFLI